MNAEIITIWHNTPALRAAALLLFGLLATRLVAGLVRDRLSGQGRPHQALLAHKALSYLGAAVVGLGLARTLGLDLSALLATAGVVTVAVGFAAQTSLSNLIAGVFLLVDRPFEVGDSVEIEGRTGMVDSINLLSTHVRTFDNMRVRWPNEVVLKATVVNLSRYPVRRVDLRVRLRSGADLAAARAAALEAAGEVAQVCVEPGPEVILKGFVDQGVEMELRAWMAPADFLAGRTALVAALHDRLTAAGVPFGLPAMLLA